MLSSIAASVEFATRQVVLRHGNSIDCMVYRKVVSRTDTDPSSTMGDFPTLGGLGVVDSEDEAQFDYSPLGEGRMLFAERFEGSPMTDRGNSEVASQQSVAQIVSTAPPGDAAYFQVQRHDVVVAMLGMGVGISYEVVQPEGTTNIPGYTTKFLLNPRDDLHFLDPFDDEPDEAPDPEPPVNADVPAQ